MSEQFEPEHILLKSALVDCALTQLLEGSVVVSATADSCVLRSRQGWEITVRNGPDGDLIYRRTR
ncbi:MAG: hypothetical protein IBX71_01475 [Candidatus Desulforudis sp.]|nr:hypothetical protein [Desulforudis sp.]